MTTSPRTPRPVRPVRLALGALTVAGVSAAFCLPAAASAADAAALRTSSGASLDGAVLAGGETVTLVATGTASVTWVLDGEYRGGDESAPFEFVLPKTTGEHRLRARVTGAAGSTRLDARFRTGAAPTQGTASAPTPSPTPAASTAPVTPATPTPTPTAPTAPGSTSPGRRVSVSDGAGLRSAVASAAAGDVITLAAGTYSGKQLEAAANGSAAHPIVLTGPRTAVLTTGSTSNGGYALHITGDRWRIEGLSVRTAKKGIVLDNSVGSVIDGVEVSDIGQEGVHFRDSSSDGVIRNSVVHDTGTRSPQFGEGIYVGSAVSNWGTYSHGAADRSDRVLIENNVVSDTPAEGVDAKEGTTGGVIRGNVFTHAGYSGENSADSWVDVKGNRWLVSANSGSGTLLDAFQTHVVTPGWGETNSFSLNTVGGGVPGVVVGIYPMPGTHGNIVTCDNTAPAGSAGISNAGCVPSATARAARR